MVLSKVIHVGKRLNEMVLVEKEFRDFLKDLSPTLCTAYVSYVFGLYGTVCIMLPIVAVFKMDTGWMSGTLFIGFAVTNLIFVLNFVCDVMWKMD